MRKFRMERSPVHFRRDGLSLRTVSATQRQRAAAEVSRYLESLFRTERSTLHSRQRSDDLLVLQPRWHLHALSRSGLHGREHGRTVDCRLREVSSTHRNSIREYASPRTDSTFLAVGSHSVVRIGFWLSAPSFQFQLSGKQSLRHIGAPLLWCTFRTGKLPPNPPFDRKIIRPF